MIRDARLANGEYVQNRGWKLMGTISASTTWTLPITDFDELYVVAHWDESSSAHWNMSVQVPRIALPDSGEYFGGTSRTAPTYANDFGAMFVLSKTTVRLYHFSANRSDKTSACTTYVYYK